MKKSPMRNFLTFVLALSLVFWGKMLLNPVPKGIAASSDEGIARAAELTSVNSTNSNAVENDGIRLEFLKAYSPIAIPKQGIDGISLDLRLDLTNHTSSPIQVGWENLIPELVGPDGQALPLQRATSERSGTSTCRLLKPQRPGAIREISSFLPGQLSWKNNKLQLKVAAGFGDVRYFDDLKPGIYQLRFTYYSSGGTMSCYDSKTREVRTVEGLGAGRITTPFFPLQLVQPGTIDSNTVEVDGIWFETVVPKRVVPIPPHRSDASTAVPIGIRITNKTSTPRFFRRFDTLFPRLIGSNGKTSPWEGGRAGSAGSSCRLLQPGKSVTFFWNAKLFWQNNKLQLGGGDSLNSVWQFSDLKPGRYHVGIDYRPMQESFACGLEPQTSSFTPLSGLPITSGVNPLVEIHLVQ